MSFRRSCCFLGVCVRAGVMAAVLAVTSCAPQKLTVSAPATSTSSKYPVAHLSAAEKAVVNAVFQYHYDDPLYKNKSVVLFEKTSADDSVPESHAGDRVDVEMIREFKRLNETSYRLAWTPRAPVTVHRLSIEEQEAMSGGVEERWEQFYRRYPNATSKVFISRVGFSKNGRTALISFAQVSGGLSGSGKICVLHRRFGMWRYDGETIGWKWTS